MRPSARAGDEYEAKSLSHIAKQQTALLTPCMVSPRFAKPVEGMGMPP
jgi:hypothetical protein